MLFSYSKTSLALVAAVLTSTLFAASAATSTTYDVAANHSVTGTNPNGGGSLPPGGGAGPAPLEHGR